MKAPLISFTRPAFSPPTLLLLAVLLAVAPAAALAQGSAAAGAPTGTALNYDIVDLIKFGGWVGYAIIVLSFFAVGLVIQYAMQIRAKALIPNEDREQLSAMLHAGDYEQAAAKGSEEGASFLSLVVAAGVQEQERGYDAVVKAMEDRADVETGRLLRKIEHLNIIANIAPMLGLLGTVMGMVNSFNQISIAVGGVDPRRLAGGIFEALMTTVMGLVVAIPSLYLFGLFRNRVDALVADASAYAEDIVAPLKKRDWGPQRASAISERAQPTSPPHSTGESGAPGTEDSTVAATESAGR